MRTTHIQGTLFPPGAAPESSARPAETSTSAARTYPEPWYELAASDRIWEEPEYIVPGRFLDDPTYPGLKALAIKAARQRIRALAGALVAEEICLWSLGVDEAFEEVHDVLNDAFMRDEETETEDEADARRTPYVVEVHAHPDLCDYKSAKVLDTAEEVQLANMALQACAEERKRKRLES
jgi:hypothetical protein